MTYSSTSSATDSCPFCGLLDVRTTHQGGTVAETRTGDLCLHTYEERQRGLLSQLLGVPIEKLPETPVTRSRRGPLMRAPKLSPA